MSWTPERLRQHAHDVELWVNAQGLRTGPKTPSGKMRSAQRSLKHGLRSSGAAALKEYLASVRELAGKCDP